MISSILVLKSVPATIGVTVEPNLVVLAVTGYESRLAGISSLLVAVSVTVVSAVILLSRLPGLICST